MIIYCCLANLSSEITCLRTVSPILKSNPPSGSLDSLKSYLGTLLRHRREKSLRRPLEKRHGVVNTHAVLKKGVLQPPQRRRGIIFSFLANSHGHGISLFGTFIHSLASDWYQVTAFARRPRDESGSIRRKQKEAVVPVIMKWLFGSEWIVKELAHYGAA